MTTLPSYAIRTRSKSVSGNPVTTPIRTQSKTTSNTPVTTKVRTRQSSRTTHNTPTQCQVRAQKKSPSSAKVISKSILQVSNKNPSALTNRRVSNASTVSVEELSRPVPNDQEQDDELVIVTPTKGNASSKSRKSNTLVEPTYNVDPETISHVKNLLMARMNGTALMEKGIGLDDHIENLYQLLLRAVKHGESNSILLVGARGTGKSFTVNHCLERLKTEVTSSLNETGTCDAKPFYVVHLNGLVHTDDRVALRSIMKQLHMEANVDALDLRSFSEILNYILNTISSGTTNSTPILFFVEEFDLFAQTTKQTLLYNLFDIVQSHQNPIAVVGMTTRLDATEMLEKRVKSRFSHRVLHFFQGRSKNDLEALVKEGLKVNIEQMGTRVKDRTFLEMFDKHSKALVESPLIQAKLLDVYEMYNDIRYIFRSLVPCIAKLTVASPFLNEENWIKSFDLLGRDHRITLVDSLSVLELCLLIAVYHFSKRQVDVVNFEMVYDEYRSFAKRASTTQKGSNFYFSKKVAFKGFETLAAQGILKPVEGFGKCPKKYRMVRCLMPRYQIQQALVSYSENCPEAVLKWGLSH